MQNIPVTRAAFQFLYACFPCPSPRGVLDVDEVLTALEGHEVEGELLEELQSVLARVGTGYFTVAPTTVYHLYARRADGQGRQRLTVEPVSREQAATLFGKFNPRSQAMLYTLPAAADDRVIPQEEL